MKFEDFKMVHVDSDYLRALHDADSEVMFKDSQDYVRKLFLGILVTLDERKYVIPLTSAKDRHKNWADVNGSYYRIYEIIDIRTNSYNEGNILVDVTNTNVLAEKGIEPSDFVNYKKRILSVLDIRKMIPVKDGVFSLANLDLSPDLPKDECNWRILTYKEYVFCKKIKSGIERRAKKIYDKQINSKKILKYHCNYALLEFVADGYTPLTEKNGKKQE